MTTIPPVPRFATTRALIDLEAYRANLDTLQHLAGDAGLLLVVKADGYGHGVEVLSEVWKEREEIWLGVATLDEGIELRELGLNTPILMMGFHCLPGVAATALEHDLVPAVFNREGAERIQGAAFRMGAEKEVHIKFDTGLRRLGPRLDELAELCEYLDEECRNLRVTGCFSHLADSSDPGSEINRAQLDAFDAGYEVIRDCFGEVDRHLLNSGGLLNFGEYSFERVRPGVLALGYPPPGYEGEVPEAEPVMQVKSRVIDLREVEAGEGVSYGHDWTADRESEIATVPMGYADGYPRALGNSGVALVGGERVPVVGAVTMDYLLLDVTEVDGVEIEDEVVLVGEQGGEEIWFDELAERAGTIHYELMSTLGRRVKRERDMTGESQQFLEL